MQDSDKPKQPQKKGTYRFSRAKKIIDKLKFNRFLRILGPGLITGAADDDPSGIATYSQAGAQFGYGQLWTALYQIPLLIAVQEACARIGAVTGKGLAGVVKEYSNKKMLFLVVCLVLVANTINIGADIGAVAAAVQLVFPLPFTVIALSTVLVVLFLELFFTYKTYAKFLKFFSLALLSYVATAFMVQEPWGQILQTTLLPHIEFTFSFLFLITGVFGTTISPYMFFWQASGEVEEERAAHLGFTEECRPILTENFLRDLKIDNAVGMIVAEAAQWFIIITTATVLFSHGVTDIKTAADAAQALEPLVSSFPNSGQIAKYIFAVGVIGLGLLAIPVLAGSAAYALAEALNWRQGLSRKFKEARGFYLVIIISILIGLAMNFVGIDPVKALVFAAVFNGVASVPLLFVIAKINTNRNILGENRGNLLSRTIVWLTFGIMACSALGMFYTLFFSH
jgi:NRAMP (natural resistance-associated macrophage protein)-like metal ion transporter